MTELLSHPDELVPTVRRPSHRIARKWALFAAVFLAVAGTAAVLSVGFGRDPSVVRSVLLGTPAPPLAGPTIQGGTVDLRQYRGKVVLVNVWASWCLACRREHPVLVAAQRDLGPKGLQIVGVDMRDTDRDALAFIGKNPAVTWPSIRDADSRHAVEWGTFAVPETYLVDRDGIIVKKAVGAMTPEWVRDNVVPMLARS